jgi:sodium-dependent dicarboxylate transporter 2/3/5
MDEPREVISAAEARFELWRRRLGLWLALPLGVAAWAAAGADGPPSRLAGIMAVTAVLWISEALPVAVTGLVSACLVVVLGVAPPKDAFAAFATPLLFLFVGSFFLAEAMAVHGLGERLARGAAQLARSKLGLLAAMSGAAFLLSLWISNTATTAVFLPIAVAIARASGDRRFAAAMVLSIAYGSTMGGIGTPIGTPPNLIGIGLLRERLGVDIGFFEWMKIGLPIGVTMLGVLLALLRLRFGIRGDLPRETAVARSPRWSQGEVAVAITFGLAVLLWIAPGILELALPGEASDRFAARATEEVVAILASAILFVWPVRGADGQRRPALTWREAARIDWGTVLLFGAGIMLGDLANKTGLAKQWGETIVALTGAESVWGITALVTAAAILLSEATSNTATATLLVPLAISLAQAAKVSPIPPALGVTIGASFGFMLPISTAPNAMAYGTGCVSIRQMAGAGWLFDLVGFVIVLAGLRLLCPLFGLS